MQTPQGTFLSGPNASFIEDLYGRYVENPTSVDPSWQTFFAELQDEGRAVLQDLKGASWAPRTGERPSNGNGTGHINTGSGNGLPLVTDAVGQVAIRASAKDSIRVLMLIRAYRVRGHLEANLDPLGLKPKESHADLNPRSYGFTDGDMDRPIFIDNVLGRDAATLREILQVVRDTYSGNIGVEYMHIQDPAQILPE